MAIDDDIINSKRETLQGEIQKCQDRLNTLTALDSNFNSIQKRKKSVPNETGGTDLVDFIPNPKNFSDADNEKIREIVYDSSNAWYDKLFPTS